jgi:hypothetical protein
VRSFQLGPNDSYVCIYNSGCRVAYRNIPPQLESLFCRKDEGKIDSVALGKGGSWVIQYADGRVKWHDASGGFHPDLVNFLKNRPRGKFIHLKLSLMKTDVFLCQLADAGWWSQAEANIEENWMELWEGLESYSASNPGLMLIWASGNLAFE